MGSLTITEDPATVKDFFAASGSPEFSSWNNHPLFGNFGRALYKAINQESGSHIPHYFAVMDGNDPLLLAPATSSVDNISMFGLPLTLGFRENVGTKRRKKAFATAFEQLQKIAKKNKVLSASIAGGFSNERLSPGDIACIDQNAKPESHIHAIVENIHDETSIHRELRSSYRSLVNWGRQALQLVYVNAEEPDRQRFEEFLAFHAKVAGGQRHGKDYWNVFWQEITCGNGELSLGYLPDGALASGTLAIDAGKTTYYTSGVYDRSMLDKPISHFPVFNSILRAGNRGTKEYDLGEIFTIGSASEKEVQISLFKKGFTSTFRLRTTWKVDLSQ